MVRSRSHFQILHHVTAISQSLVVFVFFLLVLVGVFESRVAGIAWKL